MDPTPLPPRVTEHFEISRRRIRVYSERWPIKYLVSNHGLCLGIDTKRRSFLFLAHRKGLIVRRRPVGDTVVEDLNYEIPAILRALQASKAGTMGGPTP
ncbi:MAG: hypothetical protein WCB18_08960 [Thermoplasmata archaeon]